MRLLAIALAVVVTSLPALAQETPYPDYFHRGKPTVVHGAGSDSCGSFLRNRQPVNLPTSIHYQEMAWVMGYLQGQDSFNPYDVRSYDQDGLDTWLAEYCRTHPIDLVTDAGLAFYKYIGGRAPMSTDYSIWQHMPK